MPAAISCRFFEPANGCYSEDSALTKTMDTFQKHQKELKRLEKQREKVAKRLQRKESGGLNVMEQDDGVQPIPNPDVSEPQPSESKS